jgi:hypothetical protein
MFTVDVCRRCLSPKLFAEYWLATGVVQRLRSPTRDEVVRKLAKHCRGTPLHL